MLTVSFSCTLFLCMIFSSVLNSFSSYCVLPLFLCLSNLQFFLVHMVSVCLPSFVFGLHVFLPLLFLCSCLVKLHVVSVPRFPPPLIVNCSMQCRVWYICQVCRSSEYYCKGHVGFETNHFNICPLLQYIRP